VPCRANGSRLGRRLDSPLLHHIASRIHIFHHPQDILVRELYGVIRPVYAEAQIEHEI
jgi:hypothetical protein